MSFRNAAGKVESQARAGNVGFPRGSGTITTLENMYLLFSRDAASGIADRNNGNIIVYGQNHVNVSAAVVELDGIIQKIEQQPPDLAGIKSAYNVLLYRHRKF